MDAPILVIGGTGRTGRCVVERLMALGVPARVLSRQAAPWDGVEVVRGEIADAAAVRAALRGVRGVVVVVNSAFTDSEPNAPRQVHYQGLLHVLAAAERDMYVVLVSQVYITRPERHPEVRDIIEWRRHAEAALRASGQPYTIVRPSWLTDQPGGGQGIRLEQGDRGEGSVSRADVAEACVQAVLQPDARGKSFELYNQPGQPLTDWAAAFHALKRDAERAAEPDLTLPVAVCP